MSNTALQRATATKINNLNPSETYRLSVSPRAFLKLSIIVIALIQKGLLCPPLPLLVFTLRSFLSWPTLAGNLRYLQNRTELSLFCSQLVHTNSTSNETRALIATTGSHVRTSGRKNLKLFSLHKRKNRA